MENLSLETKLKILYTDDEPVNLQNFSMNFSFNFVVLTALNADEAMAHVEQHDDIAIIVSEQRLYPVTGMELLDQIRNRLPDTVSILFSAFCITDEMVDAVNDGRLMACILKPWDMTELWDAFERARELYLLSMCNKQMIRELEEGRYRDTCQ